jgi:hypothetical protein
MAVRGSGSVGKGGKVGLGLICSFDHHTFETSNALGESDPVH